MSVCWVYAWPMLVYDILTGSNTGASQTHFYAILVFIVQVTAAQCWGSWVDTHGLVRNQLQNLVFPIV